MLLIALLLPLCTAQPSDQTYSQPQNNAVKSEGSHVASHTKEKIKTKIAQIVSILISMTKTYENTASSFHSFLLRHKFVRTCMANLLIFLCGAGNIAYIRSACGSNENTMYVTKNEKRICKIISVNLLVEFYIHYEQQRYNGNNSKNLFKKTYNRDWGLMFV